MSAELNPAKARIFRIVHAECVPWILAHGLHCRSSTTQDPHYVNIGSVDLIGNPIKLSRTPVTYRHAPPLCGADTEAVLEELLGERDDGQR